MGNDSLSWGENPCVRGDARDIDQARAREEGSPGSRHPTRQPLTIVLFLSYPRIGRSRQTRTEDSTWRVEVSRGMSGGPLPQRIC
jgi:hypothetical protein